MEDIQLENDILDILSPIEPMWSNEVFRLLHVNKTRYHRIRDKMIKEEWIKAEKKGVTYCLRELILKLLNSMNVIGLR